MGKASCRDSRTCLSGLGRAPGAKVGSSSPPTSPKSKLRAFPSLGRNSPSPGEERGIWQGARLAAWHPELAASSRGWGRGVSRGTRCPQNCWRGARRASEVQGHTRGSFRAEGVEGSAAGLRLPGPGRGPARAVLPQLPRDSGLREAVHAWAAQPRPPTSPFGLLPQLLSPCIPVPWLHLATPSPKLRKTSRNIPPHKCLDMGPGSPVQNSPSWCIETTYEICLKMLKNHCANTHKGKECKKGVAGTTMTKWPRLNLGRGSLCYSVRNLSY
ncbi:uncharacterized protein LOC122240508 [Panthera tigris]|uniref:uncharacterized protein LOC122240508 n=1 Tax=Panthera tigris TaxID=9694 RepID=UPI001C6FC439|nr:uncharacterized protein LOC122240508 [Panthera tigris]